MAGKHNPRSKEFCDSILDFLVDGMRTTADIAVRFDVEQEDALQALRKLALANQVEQRSECGYVFWKLLIGAQSGVVKPKPAPVIIDERPITITSEPSSRLADFRRAKALASLQPSAERFREMPLSDLIAKSAEALKEQKSKTSKPLK